MQDGRISNCINSNRDKLENVTSEELKNIIDSCTSAFGKNK